MFMHILLGLTLCLGGWAWFAAALALPTLWRDVKLARGWRWTICVLTPLALWAELLTVSFCLTPSHGNYWVFPELWPAFLAFLPFGAATMGIAHILTGTHHLEHTWVRTLFRIPFALLPFFPLAGILMILWEMYAGSYIATATWIAALIVAGIFCIGVGIILRSKRWRYALAVSNHPAATDGPASLAPVTVHATIHRVRLLQRLAGVMVLGLGLHLGVLYVDHLWLRHTLAKTSSGIPPAVPTPAEVAADAEYKRARDLARAASLPPVNLEMPDEQLSQAIGGVIWGAGPETFARLDQETDPRWHVSSACQASYFERMAPALAVLRAAAKLAPPPSQYSPHRLDATEVENPAEESIANWTQGFSTLLFHDAAWQIANHHYDLALADYEALTELAGVRPSDGKVMDWLLAQQSVYRPATVIAWFANDPVTPDDILALISQSKSESLAGAVGAVAKNSEAANLGYADLIMGGELQTSNRVSDNWLERTYFQALMCSLMLQHSLAQDHIIAEHARRLAGLPYYQSNPEWVTLNHRPPHANRYKIWAPYLLDFGLGEMLHTCWHQAVSADTQLATARASAAVERFRRTRNADSLSMADLVPDFLPAEPMDPYTGQALKLRSVPGGVVVYSVGWNGIDDHGMSSNPDDDNAVDEVFLLGQPFRDEQAMRIKWALEYRWAQP